MLTATATGIISKKQKIKVVPDFLVKELIDGIPIYYKGYKSVLEKKNKLVDIMGSSSLQSFILSYIQSILFRNISDKYFIATNEAGLHLDIGNNLSGDILVYKNDDELLNNINKNYFNIPPIIDIEVDVTIESSEYNTDSYIMTKSQKLLDFGTQKVIWILTGPQKIIVATKDHPWQIEDWNQDVLLLENIIINIGKYLSEKNIKL